MSNNEHPITPPPNLRQLWAHQAQRMAPHDPVAWQEHVANQAARWGADMELDACVELWAANSIGWTSSQFRAARRPKPPSLKEQALEILNLGHEGWGLANDDWQTLRHALEALPE